MTPPTVLLVSATGWSITKKAAVRHSDQSTSYHLIKLSRTSQGAACARGLYPYRQWIFLTHNDVYVHGPFDFQLCLHGVQSRDRVGEDNWIVL